MTEHYRKVTSFARRHGKASTDNGKELFKEHIAKFTFNSDKIADKAILEIGFGMGDNLINLAKAYPDHTIYGAEPFVDGHIRVIRKCVEENITNIRLFPDDFNHLHLLGKEGVFDQVYVLFADPWPKKRHFKRRLLNTQTIPALLNLTKASDNTRLIIASDHPSYQEWIEECLKELNFKYKRSETFPDYYQPTKYHQKALRNQEKHYHPIYCYYL
ncbi:MAG: hypothetical protein J0G32_05260 [Alphaproteobacteria bacterium]|nr:hypothetical protein [Alphaproteobacteria bacterium]OJV13603.1 MAG: hypothetical protein BGO27_03200 [Alphaproteobacteria bacterium 33-17]